MMKLIHGFGAALIGAAATLGCTSDDDGTGGNGGMGNTNNGGNGGTGAQGGAGAQGGGGQTSNATVDFEEASYTTSEAPSGAVDVNIVLTLPADETLTAALTVTVNAAATSSATVGEDVLDPGTFQVTFPAGSEDGAVLPLTITPVADVAREGDENLVLTFAPANVAMTGADATVVITDDDALLVGHAIDTASPAVNINVDLSDPGTDLVFTGVSALGFVAIEGAAYDDVLDVIYVVSDGDQDMLGAMDPITGVITTIGPLGWSEVNCLAFDSSTGTLYGIQDNSFDTGGADPALLTIDTSTGVGTKVGDIGSNAFNHIEGCAYDSMSNKLYGAAGQPSELIEIDVSTGAPTSVGMFGQTMMHSLVYDAGADILYGSRNTGSRRRYQIDRTAGTAQVDNAFEIYDTQVDTPAVAFDGTTWFLFFDADSEDRVVSVAANGTTTNIAPTGTRNPEATTYDSVANIMYVADSDSQMLLRYDVATGQIVGGVRMFDAAAPATALQITGLAFDANTSTIYGYDFAGDRLATINPSTGAAALTLGGPGEFILGLAYDAATDKLYGSDATSLYEINTGDGGVDADLGVISDGTFDSQSMEGLAAADGKLFGIEDDGTGLFLWEIDPAAVGASVILGVTGARRLYGLGYDPVSMTLVGIDEGRAGLGSMTTAGVLTVRGFKVFADGLACNENAGVVYASEADETQLWSLDLATGNATFIGELEDDTGNTRYNAWGLAYDPAGVLYGAEDGILFTIDPATGIVTEVGSTTAKMAGLTFNTTTSTLYGTNGAELYTIDVGTALATSVGTFDNGLTGVLGLGYEPGADRMWGVDDNTKQVITIDMTNAATTIVRATHRGSHRGVTFAAP